MGRGEGGGEEIKTDDVCVIIIVHITNRLVQDNNYNLLSKIHTLHVHHP